MWRRVEKTEVDVLAEASRFERGFPVFYRDAINTRTATESDILAFYERCEYLYGIWDGPSGHDGRGGLDGQLVGLLYFERVTDTHKNVHLDMKRGADRAVLLEGCCGVRDDRFHNGTRSTETWALARNRGIQMMLAAIGFTATGLEMRRGSSHGRILRWRQMTIQRG